MPPARHRAWLVAGLLGLSVLGTATPRVVADPGPAQLRSERTALEARERSVLYALYAQDADLARTRAAERGAAQRVLSLTQQAEVIRGEVAVARHNVRRSQEILAAQLRAMYKRPAVDPIQVVLGAGSLDAALGEVDALRRLARADRSVIGQARQARSQLGASLAALRSTLVAARAQRRDLQQAIAAIQARRADQQRLLADVRAERSRVSQRLDLLVAQASAAASRTATVGGDGRQIAAGGPSPVPDPGLTVPAAAPVETGGSLTVTATAYDLTGATASGLPAGPGMCAVDPSVIPLGSRFDVPGYGTCVAADTGSAIVGNAVDVWLPPGQAEAFGRQTLTIALR